MGVGVIIRLSQQRLAFRHRTNARTSEHIVVIVAVAVIVDFVLFIIIITDVIILSIYLFFV